MAQKRKSVRGGSKKSSRPTQAEESIFGSDGSNAIPGELLVQLRDDVAAQITESIPRGPTRGRADAGPRSFGVSALDSVLNELKVSSVTRLHSPASPLAAGMTDAVAMASTFRVRFERGVDVEEAAGRFGDLDGVEYAEPNRYRETSIIPNDPSFSAQWGLTKINCPAAWDRTTGSPNVVVAVIDTGIDLDHPELAPLLVQGTDMVDLGPNPIPPAGFRFEGDFAGRDNDPQDEVGHGTHVAGTIACLSNNGTGVAGVTWNCRLMPVRVLARIVNITNPNDVRGTGSAADIAAGIRWAADHGARVLNLSLGGTVDTQVERDAIAYAIAQGCVVVAAMGNAFNQGNPTSFPAAYPDVIAVAAIDQADHRASFSQTGPHIDVSAPGVGILSTVWDNGFTTMQGTSMASPHVAGVAALIFSCNPNLTAAQVGDIIRQTARPLRDNPGDPVPNDNYGHGCVDAEAAINRACPAPSRPIIRCPSVVTICPSQQVVCPSRPIVTCPSVATICPSQLAACPSRPIVTCPSLLTICPTRSISCASQVTVCPSRTIASCPSEITLCPSQTVVCPTRSAVTCPQPSAVIRCPSGPLCGIDHPGLPPGSPGAAMDPHGTAGYDPYGTGDWEAYDPYSPWYGEER